MKFEPETYGMRIARLLEPEPLCPLGPGQPNGQLREALEKLDPASVFEPIPTVDVDMARCCISALWLVHSFLDESHRISQQIHTPSGSYWHGIMHRREPDFSNARYWFRRVGAHEVFQPLCRQARKLAAEAPHDAAAAFLAQQQTWDPFRFIDLCEAVQRGRSAAEPLCRRIAQLEWRLLFDHCFRRATGR